MQIEELEVILKAAVEKGAIAKYERQKEKHDTHFAREFYITGVDGTEVTLEWYVNIMTLHIGSFEMWVKNVGISDTHPGFRVSLDFTSYEGDRCARIGRRNSFQG
ncbi:hypothetical protein [Escherichia phage phiWec190]|uniref:hypothetical protein n=1 Tax=Escherichia coli TaxID=562 RepID=UPI001FF258A1|nr:hypothetical protein [Escherichia coli]MCJ8478812.1 hypothetical protein [Escherichia coli]BDU13302.1 hypothetical protein [Escherichia phage phiWec188]BDU13892.1 hypothetical protein [Escherichia phage phiWec190]HCJ8320524.1 hypothetical protein [Escherichia coli]